MNPLYTKKPFIAIYQRKVERVSPGVWDDREQPETSFILSLMQQSHAVILPEYFSFDRSYNSIKSYIQDGPVILQALAELSATNEGKDTLLFGGSLILEEDGKYYNTTPVYFNGTLLATYKKRNLFSRENKTLTPGKQGTIIEHPTNQKKWGTLICADVLDQGFFNQYRGCDYIAIPVASPYRQDDTPQEQLLRDNDIFARGAEISGATLFKTCNTGETGPSEKPGRVQGRSLAASPDGVIARAPNIQWKGAILYDPEKKAAKIIDVKGSSK